MLVGLQSHALSLSDYVNDVINTHPRVREQVHIFRQVMQDEIVAKSSWRPSVDLLASASRVNDDSTLTSSDYTSDSIELSITQNLFNGFDTRYRVKQADARVHSALYELYDTADNIALDAIQAYLEALKQYRLLELAEENVVSHQETLSKIRRRSRSGAGRRSQLEQTEGRVARANAGLIAQQNNMQDALTRIHEILGRYVNINQLSKPELLNRSGLELDLLIDEALLRHPALKVAAYNIKAARYDQHRSKSSNYPKVDIKLAKEVGNDINGVVGETDKTSLVLNIAYNFYRGGADQAEQRRKTSFIHEEQQLSARIRRQVINALRLSWVADQSLEKQLNFLGLHVEQSKKTMASYREEFFIGQRDLIDLLDAKNELNSAQNRYAEAYYDYLAARYRVYEGKGSLFESLNLQAKIEDNNFILSDIQAKGEDALPLELDRDKDLETDKTDHCDNSLVDVNINEYGCLIQQAYKPIVKEHVVVKTNSPPVAVDDKLSLEQNGVLILKRSMLLENDKDADNDAIKIDLFTQPKKGRLALDANKNLIYRAPEDFIGTDHFTYTISDSNNTDDTATVYVEIDSDKDISLDKVQYVNFASGKSELTNSSREKVKRIIQKLIENPEVIVSIYAYTDNVGSDQYNLNLSNRRANATRKYMLQSGITSQRIKSYGGGEDNPIADNDTEDGKAINRRGEFHFSKPRKFSN